MASLGIPILGDPLYPDVIPVAAQDFSAPLQLLAQRIEFDDPLTGLRREFVSSRRNKGCRPGDGEMIAGDLGRLADQ
jgi:tRNA pseudouridine32 synthase/23S rRNA pseudouridine746 synthase